MEHALAPESPGVYFFFSPVWRRIVYVGTANTRTLRRRIEQHKALFRDGKRTMWRVAAVTDVYLSMATTVKSCALLQRTDVVFVPGVPPSNWQRFQEALACELRVPVAQAVDAYMSALDVYCAETSNGTEARQHERALQTALNQAYKLGYYKQSGQSWLGKVESVEAGPVGWRLEGEPPAFREDSVERAWFTAA